MATLAVQPFTLSVPEKVLVDLRRRLASSRWPDQLHGKANKGWAYGAELGYMQELCTYWERHFDWRAAERRFNAMASQFTAIVDGRTLHFVHQRCTSQSSETAPALLLSHGWPVARSNC